VSQQLGLSRQTAESQHQNVMQLQARLENIRHSTNPHVSEQTVLSRLLKDAQDGWDKLRKEMQQLAAAEVLWQEVHKAFKRDGIQSFALEGVLGQLEV
jgi:DNA repair exonuclease SbcCD ATPase subunit